MRTLLSKEDLHDGVTRMADKIAACYENRQLTIVGVLTGSVVLMADLIRVLDLPMRVGVLQASSYRGATTTRGELVINSELMLDISGRDVLLVDDIFDTGHTLARTLEKMREFEPDVDPLGGAAAEAWAAGSRLPARFRGVRYSGRVCRWLRARLRGHVSQPAVSRGARAGRHRAAQRDDGCASGPVKCIPLAPRRKSSRRAR